MGGGIATLAADWSRENFGGIVKLYTFGAPRVGFGEGGFAANLTRKLLPENIYRVNHSTDPVTMISLFPFIHAPTVGWSCCIPYGGLVISFAAHKMDRYGSSVAGRKWIDLYKPPPSFATDIKAWLEDDSIENPNSATFWNKLNYAAAYIVQAVLSVVAVPIVAGLTIADHLAIILNKGILLAIDVSRWVFLFIRKMMRMLGMKAVETIEELTETLIRTVLNRVLKKIYDAVAQAIRNI